MELNHPTAAPHIYVNGFTVHREEKLPISANSGNRTHISCLEGKDNSLYMIFAIFYLIFQTSPITKKGRIFYFCDLQILSKQAYI